MVKYGLGRREEGGIILLREPLWIIEIPAAERKMRKVCLKGEWWEETGFLLKLNEPRMQHKKSINVFYWEWDIMGWHLYLLLLFLMRIVTPVQQTGSDGRGREGLCGRGWKVGDGVYGCGKEGQEMPDLNCERTILAESLHYLPAFSVGAWSCCVLSNRDRYRFLGGTLCSNPDVGC